MILSIEGLKGSGKSTLVSLIKENFIFNISEKYTRGRYDFYKELIDFRRKYVHLFKNIDSSLALQFNSNLFHNLLHFLGKDVILEKGILTLGGEGYYGYVESEENLNIVKYKSICKELYEISLAKYRDLVQPSVFVILDCGLEERVNRIRAREKSKKSDIFFLENMPIYEKIFENSIENAKKALKNATFFRFMDDGRKDIENILGEIKKKLTCKEVSYSSGLP